jgi:hypothetical protein
MPDQASPRSDPAGGEGAERRCGDCSLCCTVLRVDALSKLGGRNCVHQDADGPGCAIHEERPQICRAYHCLWLQGGLELDERPDRLGAVIDVRAEGPTTRLEIREARAGVFDASPALQAIAERFRVSMPVRITDVEDVMDPDRPYRVLLPGGEAQHVAGEWTEIHRPGRPVERRRLPLLERWLRRGLLGWKRRRMRALEAGGSRHPGAP